MALGLRVNLITQLISHVAPSSAEKACSQTADVAVMSFQ